MPEKRTIERARKKRRAQVKHPPPRAASSSARRSITSAKASTASDRRSSYRHRTIEGQARRREARPAAEREEGFSQKDPAFGAPRARCRQGAAARAAPHHVSPRGAYSPRLGGRTGARRVRARRAMPR